MTLAKVELLLRVTSMSVNIAVKAVMIYPANTRRSLYVGTMLARRLRRWPNIVPTLVERLMFAEEDFQTPIS